MKAWQATKNGVRTILVLVAFAFSDLWSCRCRSRNTTRRLCFGALLPLTAGALCCVDGDVWQVAVPIPELAFVPPTAQSAFSTHTYDDHAIAIPCHCYRHSKERVDYCDRRSVAGLTPLCVSCASVQNEPASRQASTFRHESARFYLFATVNASCTPLHKTTAQRAGIVQSIFLLDFIQTG